jgi:outer membrane receptor for ferrienterochelin and colicins
MKEKATVSFNVSDVFNTSKRITQVTIPNLIESYGELQFRQRQLTVSFTYRFNRKKTDREPRRETEDRGGEFQG